MSKKTLSDSWKRDFSFDQFRKDMSFSREKLKLYFWMLLILAALPMVVECGVIIYLVLKFSLEGRGFLALGMGGCFALFFVFSAIFLRGGILLTLKEEAEKRSLRSLIWGFCVMFACGLVAYSMY